MPIFKPISLLLISSTLLIYGKSEMKAIYGNATISSNGPKTLVETDAQRAVLEWGSLSVLEGEELHFIQPDKSSSVLNRIVGGSLSEIYGRLESNGRVILINPKGFLVGANGVIEANGGFIATTLDIPNDHFLKEGKNELVWQGETEGSIINLGKISSKNGDIYLLAKNIENYGKVQALEGYVGMANGSEILVKPSGHKRIYIKSNFQASDEALINDRDGIIEALTVELQTPYFLALKNSGKINALSTKEERGRILLVSSRGELESAGELLAPGGEIAVIGNRVKLTDEALIDVSSEAQAGTITIGTYKQSPPSEEKMTCNSCFIGENVVVKADSQNSHAGKILIYSDYETVCNGNVSARSYAEYGNGGFVEVSGKEKLWITKNVDVRRGLKGQHGQLLCDPGPITIDNSLMGGPNTFGDSYIVGQLAMGDFAILTANGTNPGDEVITVEGVANITWANNTKLTLTAGQSIDIQDGAVFSNTNGVDPNFEALWLEANLSDTAGGTYSGVTIGNSNFSTVNGNIVITGYGGSDAGLDQGKGVFMMNPVFTLTGTGSEAGSLTMTGVSAAGPAENHGIDWQGGIFSSIDGDITFHGTSRCTGIFGAGIVVVNPGNQIDITGSGNLTAIGSGGPTGFGLSFGIISEAVNFNITLATGEIVFTGTSNSVGGDSNTGIRINSSGTIATTGTIKGQGNITLTGVGGVSGNSSYGIEEYFDISTVAGDITINGLGNIATSGGSIGIVIDNGTIQTTGTGANAGNITLFGTASNTPDSSIGIDFDFTGLMTTVDGDISLTGVAGDASTTTAKGIIVEAGYVISSTGSGNVSLTGTGGVTPLQAPGIQITGLNSRVTTTEGNLTLTGVGGAATSTGYGIIIDTGGKVTSVANTSLPTVRIRGTGGAGQARCGGIQITSSTSLISVNRGDVLVRGVGSGSGSVNSGIDLSNGAKLSFGGTSNSIFNVQGVGSANGTTSNHGITLSGVGTLIINDTGGALTVRGTAGGSGGSNSGVYLSSSGRIVTGGPLTLNVIGTAASGADCYGIKIDGASSSISSSTAPIIVTGTGGSAENAILLQNRGSLGGATINNKRVTAIANGNFDLISGGRIIGSADGIVVNTTRDLSIAPSTFTSGITPNGGSATITVGRDLTLGLNPILGPTPALAIIGSIGPVCTSDLIFPSIGRNVNVTPQNDGCRAVIGHTLANLFLLGNVTGNITMTSVGGSVTVQGANVDAVGITSGRAQIGHVMPVNAIYQGSIDISAGGDISVYGGNAGVDAVGRIGHGGLTTGTYFPSNNSLKAGVDINIISGIAEAEVVNNNGDLLLVVDNAFPTFPLIGPGSFTIASLLTASGDLQIYTVAPALNSINDLINGANYTEAPFGVDTDNQFWDIYYPNGSLSGGAFTLYYKVGPIRDHFITNLEIDSMNDLQIAESQLQDLTPLYKYMRLPLFPYYRTRICTEIMSKDKQKRRECLIRLNPYKASRFDDVYYVN